MGGERGWDEGGCAGRPVNGHHRKNEETKMSPVPFQGFRQQWPQLYSGTYKNRNYMDWDKMNVNPMSNRHPFSLMTFTH